MHEDKKLPIVLGKCNMQNFSNLQTIDLDIAEDIKILPIVECHICVRIIYFDLFLVSLSGEQVSIFGANHRIHDERVQRYSCNSIKLPTAVSVWIQHAANLSCYLDLWLIPIHCLHVIKTRKHFHSHPRATLMQREAQICIWWGKQT